jgi:predicted nucleic acid-binding protein
LIVIYLDTSALVALLTNEPATAKVSAWFADNALPLVSGDWCAVEFASALAAKQRAKQLRAVHVKAAHAAFETLCDGGLQLVPVSRAAFYKAAALCKPADTGLRAGDALHLAVALDAGCTALAGLDAVVNSSAQVLGLTLAF